MFPNRNNQIKIIFLTTIIALTVRFFFLQVFNNEYSILANKNIISSTKIYPQRGTIRDRNGEILVYNEPIFNIDIIPRDVKKIDIDSFCRLFNISRESFDKTYNKACIYSKILPSTFVRNISMEQFLKIETELFRYKDVFIDQQFIRKYKYNILANVIGYVNKKDKDDKQVFGVTGIEKQYENELSGEIGIKHEIVDVHRNILGKYKNGKLDVLVINGEDLFLTIDAKLQEYGELLMKDKIGSIVAIQPKTGEILSMVSSPTYNPNDLAFDNDFAKHYIKICSQKDLPLLNRCVMCTYPPGSTFKIVEGMFELEEKIVDIDTKRFCDPTIMKCHNHVNPLNIVYAIANSCNYFFYYNLQQFLKAQDNQSPFESANINLQIWNKYIYKYNLGYQLGVDLPNEKSGFIPNSDYYDMVYGKRRWKGSMIKSLAIGQGEILTTPIQLANLAAIFANRGFYVTPHLNKKTKVVMYDLDVNKNDMDTIINGMSLCSKEGNGKRAAVKGIDVCGKTGTAQNYTTKDNAVFIGFAPKDNPEIAIAVYVEQGGWGAVEAAEIFRKFVSFYFNIEDEEFVSK